MESLKKEEPCLEKTSQGSSCLETVLYKSRYLYSKYNPSRSIISSIEKLNLLPGTLVILASPALWYGLNELQAKIPENCLILALEAEGPLLNFSKKQLALFSKKLVKEVILEDANDFSKLDTLLRSFANTGEYKRAVKIDFSAGVQFAKEKYEKIYSAAEELIAQFWKNRITLTKFGRLYNKNIFRNLLYFTNFTELNDVSKKVEKPILVCGAGESLENTLESLKKPDDFFIIAADASLSVLEKHKLKADAVVALEAQNIIQKAYIGIKNSPEYIFLDLCSRPEIPDVVHSEIIYFLTEYSSSSFIKTLSRELTESVIPPMGSVGLAATYIALRLRKSEETPVYLTGLDFCFTRGKTHSRGTPQHTEILLKNRKLSFLDNIKSTFSQGTFDAKNNKSVARTTIALSSYAKQFKEMFSSEKNLFSLCTNGLYLGLEIKETFEIKGSSSKTDLTIDKKRKMNIEKAKSYYENELKALEEIKDLLINGDSSDFRTKKISLEEQLKNLIEKRDYLYLHFPDGYKYTGDISFLKRVRAEIDYFSKQIRYGIKRSNMIK